MNISVFCFSIAVLILSPLININAAEVKTVSTQTLAEVAIFPERSAPATVVSLNSTTVSSRIQAQVDALPVRVGDIVTQGNTLVKLDCTDYELAKKQIEASLESLQAQLSLAKRRLERTKQLTLKQSVSEELLDERESDLNVINANINGTKAELKQARINIDRCLVKSPFRALIIERISAVGQYTNIGTALLMILDIDNLEVSAQIHSQDSAQIKAAESLWFTADDKRQKLNLRRISESINSETRNREVRLVFDNETALPGATGNLNWQDNRPHIPGEYLVRRAEQYGVFTINGDRAEFIPIDSVQAGRASPTTMSLDSRIVTEGQYSINHNDIITIQE
ncbi:MAG: efflux RND transporter periplasmic adaptor subunit [Pseudomonadota bacterium]